MRIGGLTCCGTEIKVKNIQIIGVLFLKIERELMDGIKTSRLATRKERGRKQAVLNFFG